MFGFFKKKKKQEISKELIVKELSHEEKSQIEESIKNLQQKIEDLDPADNEALAAKYEQLGLLHNELSQVDEAIISLEKSLNHQKSIGDGYKELMKLYNQKRAEAARNKDDNGIQKWMNKMDEMRQIAKEVTLKIR